MAPAGGSFKEPLTVVFTDQWTTTVTLTNINSPLIQPCAQHGVMDLVRIALEAPNHEYKKLLFLARKKV